MNLNWYDDAYSAKDYLYRAMMLDIYHLFGKKIIYTLHDRQTHFEGDHQWNTRMRRKLCISADCIVGLCPDTEEVIREVAPTEVYKLRVIPHPNYIGNYEKTGGRDLRLKYGFEQDDLVLLLMSTLKPYKNIETLIQVVKEQENPHLKLLLAGAPKSEEYKAKLLSLIGGCDRIRCDFRFIPDDEVEDVCHASNLIVLPYQKRTALNSGNVFLAFSMRRTVICSDIGTIHAMEDQSFVYSYTYQEESEHADRLRECISRVVCDYEANPQSIMDKGMAAYTYVKQYHSDVLIREKYKELYDELLVK